GTWDPIDAVIDATAHQPNLDYLAGLGALDAAGRALHRRGVSTTVPRLAYVGLHNQWTYASATLRGVGPDAAYVVGALRRQVDREHTNVVRRVFGAWRCCAGKEGAI